jgi:hypothetical protein
MVPVDFDGCGEMHVRSVQDWLNFAADPDFVKTLMGELGGNFLFSRVFLMSTG